VVNAAIGAYTVDALWPDHRLVVELDAPDAPVRLDAPGGYAMTASSYSGRPTALSSNSSQRSIHRWVRSNMSRV
jgi:hypothetical protein